MWVKICGNTNLEDALLAAELGADAVGFVFAPSVRQVTVAQVRQIVPHLPATLERVGVFAAWSADEMLAAVDEAGLTTVQLHGGLDPELARVLLGRSPGLRIIHVAHWTEETNSVDFASRLRQIMMDRTGRVLIDTKVGLALGGTGRPFDWEAARGVFGNQSLKGVLILAGGLNQENVGAAIELVQPWGVDVSSGVEARAGKKDPEKLAAFIKQARAVRERSESAA